MTSDNYDELYSGPDLETLPIQLTEKLQSALEVLKKRKGVILETTRMEDSWPKPFESYNEIYKTDFGCLVGSAYRFGEESYSVRLRAQNGNTETDQRVGLALGLDMEVVSKIEQPEPGVIYFGK